MKKLLFLFLMVLLGTSFAFAETKQYKNGEVTAYYSGNRAEIVDNVNNVCIIVSVERTKNSVGEWVYEFACNNKTTKGLTKLTLNLAISAGITAVAGPTSGAITSVATYFAGDFYDRVCEYYAD